MAEAAEMKADVLTPFDASSNSTLSAYASKVNGEDTDATTSDKVAGLKTF